MVQELRDRELADDHDISQEHANALLGVGSASKTSAGKDNENKSKPGGFYNPGGDAVDSTSLGGMEKAAAGVGAAAGAAGAIGNATGLFTGNETSRGIMSWFSTKQRKGIAGTAIGLFIAGGVFMGFTAGSGPFEFIHLSQLLQQFHLNEQSDQSDDRLSRLTRMWRYAKTGDVEQTRLGIFANTYANAIEAKLNKSGITSSYDEVGRFTGYVVDTENENFKGKSNDEIKQYFKDTYGVDVTTNEIEGKLTINTEKNGYFATRKLIGTMLENAGLKGVTGAVQGRIMAKRAGLTLHPIKILDNKVKSSVYDQVRKQFNSDVEQGSTENPSTVTAEDNPADAGKNGDPAKAASDKAGATAAANDTNSALNDAAAASTGDVKAGASFKAKLGLGAGGGAAALGVACTIKALDKDVTARKAETVAQLARFGGDVVALGSQAQYGGQTNTDFINQLGYFQTKYFNSTEPGNTGSWTDAASIQAELHQNQTGVKPDTSLSNISKGSPLGFIENVPGLGAACSGVGLFLQNAFAFVTGPVSFAVSIAANQAIAASGVFNTVLTWLAGKALPLDTVAGPQFGNYVNFGTLIAANDKAIAAGGGALTAAESVQLSNQQLQEADSAFKGQSFAYRLFSPNTSKSVVGSLIDAQNPNIAANTSQVASSFLNIGSSLLSLPAKFFSTVVHADTTDAPYDYGFPTYGFSASELSDPNVSNPYTNADYVVSNLLPNSSVISAAQSCFGVTISSDGSQVQAASQNGITNVYDGTYSTTDCRDGAKAGVSSEDWLRVRMFIFDSETADSASCYQGNAASCANVGFGTASTSGSATGAVGTPTLANCGSDDVATCASKLAQQLLNDPNYVPLPYSSVRQDLQSTVDKTPINNSDTCGNTVTINPDLLQVMLTATQKYKIEPINIITGHGCDQFLHPKGRATDIDFVTDLATGKRTNFTSGSAGDDTQLDHDFYVYIASILPAGGELGQDECAGRTGIAAPPNITFFSDTCTHQHVDLGNAK